MNLLIGTGFLVAMILILYALREPDKCPKCGHVQEISANKSHLYWHYKCWACGHKWLGEL